MSVFHIQILFGLCTSVACTIGIDNYILTVSLQLIQPDICVSV